MIFAITAIALLALAGCVGNGDNTTTPEIFGNISNIQVSANASDIKENYSSFHEYGNDGQEMIIWADKPIREFALITVTIDESFNFKKNTTLHSIEKLTPEKPLLVKMTIPEGMPTHGISFKDGNQTKYYYIGYSGIDGSLSFVEFEN